MRYHHHCFLALAIQSFLVGAIAPQSFPAPGPGRAAVGAAGPTITVTSAVCVGTNTTSGTAGNIANCTLGASGAVGDLLIVRSKTASSGAATVTYSFTGTSSCTLTTVNPPAFQPNGGGTFTVASAGCIITTTGANTPVATWTGSSTFFTDIEAFTIHTTTSWKTTFVDAVSTPVVATTTGVTCPTGTTAATTTANDFILATCDVFNAGQTWGALSGFTQYAAASRNTAGIYYKTVTSTGTQTAIVPLSTTDFGVGMIAAFASN
jgi:hypothetical protein